MFSALFSTPKKFVDPARLFECRLVWLQGCVSRVVGSVLEGPGGVLRRVWDLGAGLAGSWSRLGALLGGLGRPFGGSVALLGAKMAEKSDKTAKKVVWINRWNANLQEKWPQRGPNWGQKGAKIEPKSDQKPSLKSASILS